MSLFAHFFSVPMGFKEGAVLTMFMVNRNFSGCLRESNVFNYLILAHRDLTSSEERGKQNPKYCEHTLYQGLGKCPFLLNSFCI